MGTVPGENARGLHAEGTVPGGEAGAVDRQSRHLLRIPHIDLFAPSRLRVKYIRSRGERDGARTRPLITALVTPLPLS
jgi:hypothetical protein